MVVGVGSSLEVPSLTHLLIGLGRCGSIAILSVSIWSHQGSIYIGGFSLVKLLSCVVFYREQYTQETAALYTGLIQRSNTTFLFSPRERRI